MKACGARRQPMSKKKLKCKLPPFEVQYVATLQEAKEVAGWNITAFDLPKAWAFTQGEGVKVAVIDSGCDLDHPDLVENLLPGKNFVNPALPPEDDNGHGTHVSGIIAAMHNDIGMVGVAPKTKIIPIKVLDKTGNGLMEVVAQGIRYAVDVGADIIAMSLGSPKPLQQVRRAIQYAAAKGVVVIVAAGNAGLTKDIFYPAAYPETIAIGSIGENFDRSKFSCTGMNLDFMAPGDKIFSTVPDNWYAVMSGTSMAAPFVVGVAALVLSYVRKNKTDIVLKSVEDYRNLFRQHTTPLKNADWANKTFYQGFGILDPRSILEEVKD